MVTETRSTTHRILWGWLPAIRDEGEAMADDTWCRVMGAEAGDRAAREYQHDLFTHLEGLDPERAARIMDAVGQMVMEATYVAVGVAVAATQHGATPRTADPDVLERRLASIVRHAGFNGAHSAIVDPQRVATLAREYETFMDTISGIEKETAP